MSKKSPQVAFAFTMAVTGFTLGALFAVYHHPEFLAMAVLIGVMLLGYAYYLDSTVFVRFRRAAARASGRPTGGPGRRPAAPSYLDRSPHPAPAVVSHRELWRVYLLFTAAALCAAFQYTGGGKYNGWIGVLCAIGAMFELWEWYYPDGYH